MILTKEDGTEEVSSGDVLAGLLFDLLRDWVPFGIVEKILKETEDSKAKNGGQLPRIVFADPNLGKYVCLLTDRIHELSGWGSIPHGCRIVPAAMPIVTSHNQARDIEAVKDGDRISELRPGELRSSLTLTFVGSETLDVGISNEDHERVCQAYENQIKNTAKRP